MHPRWHKSPLMREDVSKFYRSLRGAYPATSSAGVCDGAAVEASRPQRLTNVHTPNVVCHVWRVERLGESWAGSVTCEFPEYASLVQLDCLQRCQQATENKDISAIEAAGQPDPPFQQINVHKCLVQCCREVLYFQTARSQRFPRSNANLCGGSHDREAAELKRKAKCILQVP